MTMSIFTLDEVYRDPESFAILGDDARTHREMVIKALHTGEAIRAYWWERDITGLVLATDRRILQFPRFQERTGLFSFRNRYEVWAYPYAEISDLSTKRGGIFEFAQIIVHREQADDAIICFTRARPADLTAIKTVLGDLIAGWQADGVEAPPLNDETIESSLADQLQVLYTLYQNGGLDEEEYRRAKARLLEE
jgi:hypothetical protein